MVDRPIITLQSGKSRRLRHGHPWIYSNEIAMDEMARSLDSGGLVWLAEANGKRLGIASFNPHSLIAARLITHDPGESIDRDFWKSRFKRALTIRERLYEASYYRLIHSEADGFPGLIVDRYGDALVLQVNSAGMERNLPDLLDALDAVLTPKTVVIRADTRAREIEGLERYVRIAKGTLDGPIELVEGSATFFADLESGQKTGWYFDQRDNRAFVARLANNCRVLDLFCNAGGFALQTALAGAREVLGIDSSGPALDLAHRAAEHNGVAGYSRFERAKLFDRLSEFAGQNEKFDIVIADPPSFAASKRDLKAALRAYRKLVRQTAALVEREGVLMMACCSHNVPEADFFEVVARGLGDAGRSGRVLRRAGAGADHPIHPELPESAYLKCLVVGLD